MLEANNNNHRNLDNQNKIKLLFYNKFWNYEYPDEMTSMFSDISFFFNEEDIHEADAVVFHVPSLQVLPQELKDLKKKKGQLWVYWSIECDEHYPEFQAEEIKNLFDLTATYRLDADFPMPYISMYKYSNWRQPPVEKTEFINAFFSSRWDKSGRYDYLAELMSYLDVHSFGKIFNNKPRDPDPYFKSGLNPDSFRFKEEVISKYKFTLAFENAKSKDYVTEKFFQPLLLGSIPVYMGAPNIDDFVPGDNCYINVSSFSSVKELADYLILLDNDDELYNEYFQWKNLPFKNKFETNLNLPQEMMLKRIILGVKEKLQLEALNN